MPTEPQIFGIQRVGGTWTLPSMSWVESDSSAIDLGMYRKGSGDVKR
jgi:hypothetical protein